MTLNTSQGEIEGSHPRFTVTSDVKSYTGNELADMANDIWGGKSFRLMGYGPYETIERGKSGRVYVHAAGTNYLAKDLNPNLPSSRLDKIAGVWIGTQIHESGNTLQGITGKDIGLDNPENGDHDSGQALEQCVADKLNAEGYN